MKAISLSLAAGTQAYREATPDAAPDATVVLLHGISSSAGSWEPLAPYLATSRLLAWDAPGYGISQGLSELKPTALHYARRLETWLESMGVEECVLVGHSLGAMVACAYLVRFPARVRGLVLADPAEGYRHFDENKRQEVYESRWPELARLGAAGYAKRRAPRLLHPDTSELNLNHVRREMAALKVEGFRQASWMLANDCLSDYVPGTLPVPGLVVCGEQDTITPPQGAEQLAGRLDCEFELIPKAGHASYIDNPDAFARSLKRFVHQLNQTQRL